MIGSRKSRVNPSDLGQCNLHWPPVHSINLLSRAGNIHSAAIFTWHCDKLRRLENEEGPPKDLKILKDLEAVIDKRMHDKHIYDNNRALCSRTKERQRSNWNLEVVGRGISEAPSYRRHVNCRHRSHLDRALGIL